MFKESCKIIDHEFHCRNSYHTNVADLHHSTNPPAPPLPAELVPVQYATVNKPELVPTPVNVSLHN